MVEDDKRKARARASEQIHAAIDRIEDGGMAVLLVGEDEKTKVDIPASLLPKGAAVGDHLRITITLDRESGDAARERVRKLQEELKQQSNEPEEKKNFKL